jgi:hypothetical protein
VSVQFGRWGVRGGGPDHGGGPLLSFEHIRFPNDFNPVNHPFRLSEMTESPRGLWRVYRMEFSGIYRMDLNGL